MKKIQTHHNEYDLIKKQLKASQISNRGQRSHINQRNSKIVETTGSNPSQIQRQYQRQSRKSSDKTCSIVVFQTTRKRQPDDSNTKASKDLSNNPSKFSTMAQLQNQIQRLTTQLSIKSGQLREISKNQQKRKVQIIQLEKMVNYYQGRLDMVQNQLKNYEQCFLKIGQQCDERSKYKSQVEQLVSLFQGLRKQNEILNGKYQQKSYQLNKISQKYLRLKQKLRRQHSRKDQTRINHRENQSQPKKTKSSSLLKRVYQSANDQKERQNYIRTLNAKIQQVQDSIVQINKQNQRLCKQLEQKDDKIDILNKQIKSLKTNIVQRSKSKSRNKLKMPQKRSKKQNQIKLDKKNHTYQQYFPKEQSSVMSELTIKSRIHDPSATLFRKIRYNLMYCPVTYDQFLQKLSQNDIQVSTFTSQPYNLKEQQALQLLNWKADVLKTQSKNKSPIRQSKQSTTSAQSCQKQQIIKTLKSRIQKYKNLPIKKQHILKINIFNTYLNREQQFIEQILRQRYLDYYNVEEYFKYWGLNNTQIDIILKSFYEETGQIKQVDLEVISSIIIRWEKL